jgi:ribonuclease HI
MRTVTIHADGACSRNGCKDAIGGVGVVLIGDGPLPRPIREISIVILPDESCPVTNQRAELLAVITGMEALKKPNAVTVSTDSQYVLGIMDGGWKAKENLDLIERLREACKTHKITWIWTRGHQKGNTYNNRCDQLATEAIRNNYTVPKNYLYETNLIEESYGS